MIDRLERRAYTQAELFTECVNIATDLLRENPNNEVLIQYLRDARILQVGNLNANVLSAPGFHYAVQQLINNIRNMLGEERHAVVLNQPLRGGRFNQRQTALLNTLDQHVRDFVRNLVLRDDILSAFSRDNVDDVVQVLIDNDAIDNETINATNRFINFVIDEREIAIAHNFRPRVTNRRLGVHNTGLCETVY